MQGGIKISLFSANISLGLYLIETIQNTALVTMECEYETLPNLSNRTIFIDLERPLTLTSSPQYYLT